MKRVRGLFLALLGALFLICSDNNMFQVPSIYAAEITISDSNVYLTLGSKKITHTLKVNNVSANGKITYKSLNPKIAKVNSKGKITAVSGGLTKIETTVTSGKNEKVFVTEVRVYDPISSIELMVDNGAVANRLRKNVSYQIGYECKTVGGTNANTTNIIHYEVLTGTGKPTENAKISEKGVFTAKKVGNYYIKVKVFENRSVYENWLANPIKYQKKILAEDDLLVSVAAKSGFALEAKTLAGWSLSLPKSYEAKVTKNTKKVKQITISPATQKGKTFSSNISIMAETSSTVLNFDDMALYAEFMYTEDEILENLEGEELAKNVSISDFKTETVKSDSLKYWKMSYNMHLDGVGTQKVNGSGKAVFHHEMYLMCFDHTMILIHVNDMGEALQPNISDTAEQLVKKSKFTEQ